MMSLTTSEVIALSQRIGEFMTIPRATIRRGHYETDGGHTLHLQFTSVLYAAKYHPELDIGKVSLYALVHDFIELYTGDVNSLQITEASLKNKQQNEKVALKN